MLARGRYSNISLWGLLAILLAVPSLAQQDVAAPREQRPAVERSGQDGGRPPTFTLQGLREEFAAAAEREANQRHNENDLIAQVRMADAADKLAFWTIWQTGIAGLSFFLLVGTVVYARSAAGAAKAQVRHAEAQVDAANRAVDAAKEQVRIAQEANDDAGFSRGQQRDADLRARAADQVNTSRQLRAYLGVTAELGRGGVRRIELALKNYGQTPAYKVSLNADTLVAAKPKGADFSSTRPARTMPPVDPQATVYDALGINEEEWTRVRAGEVLFVFGIVNYQTFEEPRWTKFRLQLDVSGGFEGAGCRPADNGNEAL